MKIQAIPRGIVHNHGPDTKKTAAAAATHRTASRKNVESLGGSTYLFSETAEAG